MKSAKKIKFRKVNSIKQLFRHRFTIISKAQVGKSNILRRAAEKLGYQVMDIRLS